ncbi:MAG: SDR family NAD(P)-dependent oxidoreductase [Negativicutes bacterium]|jgi:NADP-dependent 3-hydroxy acid dehydrogenase YdfG
MKTKLQGKIVFITGASSGIGAACARAFAEQGANLVLTARNIDKLIGLAAELEQKYNIKVIALKMDVRDRVAIKTAIAQLPCGGKNVDILINNAGLALGMEKVVDGNSDDWDVMIDTNVKGVLNVCKELLPGIVENEGQIINIGSVAGIYPYINGAVYCASKAAVKFITDAIRMEMVDKPIKVTNIQPGMVETEFSMVRFKGDSERAKKIYAGITPLTPEDIADIVVYTAVQPKHVQICEVTVTALHQAPVGAIYKK